MTPNGDKDNENSNSKNNDKATTTPTTTTEGGERHQSQETIVVEDMAAPWTLPCAHSCLVVPHFCRIFSFPGREVYCLLLYMGINRKSGQDIIKIWKMPRSGTFGRLAVPDSGQKVKKGPWRNLALLNLESGTTFFAKKGGTQLHTFLVFHLLIFIIVCAYGFLSAPGIGGTCGLG